MAFIEERSLSRDWKVGSCGGCIQTRELRLCAIKRRQPNQAQGATSDFMLKVDFM